MQIDISGVDKVALLRELHSGQRTPAFFDNIPSFAHPQFDEHEAQKAVTGYIDYFQGRAIKTDLSCDTACPHLYDRDAGEGAFARAVERAKQN